MRSISVALFTLAVALADVEGTLSLFQRSALKTHKSSGTANGAQGAANASHHKKHANRTQQIRLSSNASHEHPTHEHQTGVLPDVSAVLRAPHRVFTAMSSQLAALETRLAEVQHQSALAVSKQKALYESKLKSQANEIHAVEGLNAQLTKKNDDIQKSNSLLRKKATTLADVCNNLQRDLEILQTNVSVAAEFMRNAIGETDNMLHNSTELAVLDELAEQEKAESSANAYRDRLGAVGMFSLLQVQAPAKNSLQPQELLQQMFASFDELPKEQNASEMALKAAFEKQYQIGADHLKLLLDEQKQINITRRELHGTHDRLNLAVKHVENIHEQLVRRSRSTRVYLEHLGGSVPPAH
jgi:hypothetical protein